VSSRAKDIMLLFKFISVELTLQVYDKCRKMWQHCDSKLHLW